MSEIIEVSILVFVELALDVGYMERTSRRHKFPMENQKKSNARG